MAKYNYLVKNNQTGFKKKYKYLKNARGVTGMNLNQIYKKSQGGLVTKFSEWEIIRLIPIEHYEPDTEDANHDDDVYIEEEQGHIDDDDDVIAVTAMDVLDLAHRALDVLENFNN